MRLVTILMLSLALISQLSLTTAYAEEPVAEVFDIDDNGEKEALTDGLLQLRYLFGFRGGALIDQALAEDATRITASEIETFITSASKSARDSSGLVVSRT